MRPGRQLLVLSAAVAAVLAGFWTLFTLRLRQGDVYPPYSSYRSDPLGWRAWHDALERLPGIEVSRHLRPVGALASAPPRAILIGGAAPELLTIQELADVRAIEDAVLGGSRVVVALSARLSSGPTPGRDRQSGAGGEEGSSPGKREDEGASPPAGEAPKSGAPAKPVRSLATIWGVRVVERWLFDEGAGAVREPGAPDGFPETLPWKSDVHFHPADPEAWRVLYRRAGEPVMIERRLGRGSAVLVADSYFGSNESLHREPPLAVLSWMTGPFKRVEFCESHLGVGRHEGVAALGRRYGLGGALALSLVTAALFVWRSASRLVPEPAPEVQAGGAEVSLAEEPGSGMTALLRRALAPSQIAAACVEEWRRARRGTDAHAPGAVRLESVWKNAQAEHAGPVATFNALRKAVKRT